MGGGTTFPSTTNLTHGPAPEAQQPHPPFPQKSIPTLSSNASSPPPSHHQPSNFPPPPPPPHPQNALIKEDDPPPRSNSPTNPFNPENPGNFKHHNTTPPTSTSINALFNNRGKVAVVTGASAGIGLAVTEALAESGCDVSMWYHSHGEQAEQKARDVSERFGVRCKAYPSDIRSAPAISHLLSLVLADFGRLDIFVANAGIPWTQGGYLEGSLQHYRSVMTTDLDSVFYCARAAGEVWKRQYESGVDAWGRVAGPKSVESGGNGEGGEDGDGDGEERGQGEEEGEGGEKERKFTGGSFVATASMSGQVVNIPQLQTAYNAAKAGVVHMMKSLSVETAPYARFNSVSPGYMVTELSDFVPPATKQIWRDKIPMGREGEVHELKGVYLWLASEASSYVTGTDVRVDGGYCCP